MNGIPSTLYRRSVMPSGVGPKLARTLRLVRRNGSTKDFHRDGDCDPGVPADLDYFGPNSGFPGVASPTPAKVMRGHNDWANLQSPVIEDARQPDGGGVVSGFERFLGTDPVKPSAGIILTVGSSVTGFQHCRSQAPGADAVAAHEWSTNLTEWHPSGEPAAGISVRLEVAVTASGPTLESVAITPKITGAPPVRFYRLWLQLLEL